MAGILFRILNAVNAAEYFQNWNTNVVSAGAVLAAGLIISGYFYGKAFQKLIRPLKNVDCTFLGVFFIIAVFQMEIFWSVSYTASTDIAYHLLGILLIGGPVVCLLTLSNPLPSWKHLLSLVSGIGVSFLLCFLSSKLTTNNLYFDSVSYLSQTIETVSADHFAKLVPALGEPIQRIDALHDLNGYYYFWGMLLRFVKTSGFFTIKGSLTPVYIWGSTILYGMSLGSLIVNSVNVIYRKMKWKGLLLLPFIIAPYYINYWNTTLAFFGNTIRTVAVGYMMLFAYLYFVRRDGMVFIALFFTYLAGICFASSSFFLAAFICAGLFVTMCITGEEKWKNWALFIVSCLPVLYYALEILLFKTHTYPFILAVTVCAGAVLVLVSVLLRNHLDIFCKVGMGIGVIAFAGLIVSSYLLKDSVFGYSFFFVSRSESDMTVNMTSHMNQMEMFRNILFYILLALILVNFKKGASFKVFLLSMILLFLNPLVQPAVSNYLTEDVYSRSFDLLINPFTICFLIWSADNLLKYAAYVVLPLFAAANTYIAYNTVVTYENDSLLSAAREEDYVWESKAPRASLELYQFIDKNLADSDNRPVILSQELGLKGYVPDISVSFSTTNYRDAMANPNPDELTKYIVTVLNPNRRFSNSDEGSGQEDADFTKLMNIVRENDPDYLVISNTMAVWDARGWFNSAYATIVNKGLAEVIWENETWAVLKINHEWEAPNKNPVRYWVHRISTRPSENQEVQS